jgi:hypothetical protein
MGNFVFPMMTPLTTEQYKWDDSKSEALNVVKMAQPAGVGNGMKDFADGTKATIGLQGSGMQMLDGALGFLTSGGFGVVQSASLSGGVNSQIEWRPTVVDIVDKDSVSENGQISFLKVRNYIAEKVKKAISVDHPNIEWGDTLTFKLKEFEPGFWQVLKGPACNEIRSFDKGGKEEVPLISNNYSKFFYDGKNITESYCAYGMDISATYTSDKNSIVIVAESNKGHYLDKAVAANYEGYVLVPDVYFANTNYKVVNEYAYLMKNGKKILFQTPE